MNLNKIYYNEDLTVLSKTEQPIRAFAQQANTIEVCAPVSGYNTAYIIFQGLVSGVVNPRLRATQRLFMSPLSDEGTYKRWNMVIPGPILNDMSLMNSTGVRVLVEFWYISGDCIGVKKYNTEEGIAALLAADYPDATDGQFVRVVDTNTDWYYDDGTSTWIDYEGQYQVGASKQPTSVADFTLEKGIYTEEPTHAPTNTEYILSEITSINAGVVAAQADIVTLEATAVTLEADKHEYSAFVGVSGEVKTKDTPAYTKLKEDELLALKEDKSNKKATLADDSDAYYPTQKAVKTAVDLKLTKDLSGLTDGAQIESTDLIYVYTSGGESQKIAGSELTQLIKTIEMNTSTYVLTITKYDGTATTIDLPAEMAFVSASYSDVTEDLTFTLQNGSTVTVPLDDLVNGLASEAFVNAEIDKIEDGTYTAKKAEQDADGNVIADTYATKTEAQALELNIALHEQRIDETEETLRKALNSDGTAIVDDDGTGIIAMGKDVAPAPLKVQVDGLLLDSPQLVTNPKFDANVTNWTAVAGTNAWLTGGYLQNTANGISNVSYIYQSVFNLTDKYYSIARARVTNEVSTGIQIRHGGTVITTQSTPAINTWYLLSGVFIPTNDTLRIYHTYSDSATANGKVMEADYVYTFNITTLITAKQYSPLYSTTFDLMSDAEIKAQMDLWVTDGTLPDSINAVNMNKRIRATGKNLFDKSAYATSYAYKIRIKPSTAYVWSASTAYKTYDKDLVELVSATGTTVTTGATAVYIAFSGVANVDTFQLELGTVATTYEAYKDSDLYLQADSVGYSYQGTRDSIELRDGKAYFIKRINDTHDGLLATPVTTEIKSSGILNGYASGHIYIDDMIKDQDIYTTNIAVTDTSRPIIALGEILKMNTDLSTTKLPVSGATIAGDGLSFTHTGLTAGDIVVFTYYYGDGIKGLTTVTYYDEKTVVVDSVTAKVYKITPAIASGVLSWTLTEI